MLLQYLVSGRSWAIVDRQPAVTVPGESASTEAHIVATLPYARHAFLPSAPNIPKSATATWGHLNKNLMWKVTNSPLNSLAVFLNLGGGSIVRRTSRSFKLLYCYTLTKDTRHFYLTHVSHSLTEITIVLFKLLEYFKICYNST